MFTRKLLSIILVMLMVVLMAAPTFAQGPDTLNKVLNRGVLRVGVLTTGPPWGFLDEKYELVGFDVDIAKEMAKELGVKLELVETLNINRVPYLTTDRVDIIIACFANTLERAKSVAFSQAYAPFMLVLCGPKDVKINSLKDLSGKKVALGRGTTSDLHLSEKAPKDAQLLRYESPTDAFLAVEQGKAHVFAEGYDHAMYQIKTHPNWEIKGEPFAKTYPCMAVKQGDLVWLDWVNLFILHKLNDGVLQDLYAKWFNIPWPEAGIWPSF
jgi:polar amino acid transport system substrate-binding protein